MDEFLHFTSSVVIVPFSTVGMCRLPLDYFHFFLYAVFVGDKVGGKSMDTC